MQKMSMKINLKRRIASLEARMPPVKSEWQKILEKLTYEELCQLEKIAESHNATIHQIALAWLANISGVITISKAFQLKHVEANAEAGEIILSPEEMKLITNE